MRASHLLKTAVAVSAVLLTTTVFSVSAQANDEFYQIVNVRADDSLNIRAGAGVNQPVISTIPANGRTILSTGNTQQVGNSTWIEVVWLGQIGWVNGFYLTRDLPPVVQQVQAQRKNPAQVNYDYQQPVQPVQPIQAAPVNNTGATHVHPANECTRSVTHTHPNGANNHRHNYSCQRGQRPAAQPQQQRAQAQQYPRQAQQQYPGQAHKHPANRCTRSVTHSHPNGANNHQHRYSCQNNQQVRAPQRQPQNQNQNVYAHSHPANPCTRSVTHSHSNGNAAHSHRYSCQAQQMARPKYNPQPKYVQQYY